MSPLEMVFHDVKAVTLKKRFLSNYKSRTIHIEMEDGKEFQIVMYGNTGKLEMLPKHKEFYDADA